MQTSIENMLKEWSEESKNSLSIMRVLTDQSLNQKVYDGGRTLGGIAWHIVLTLGEMTSTTGLTVEAPTEYTPAPNKASEIADIYEKTAASLGKEISEKWTDAMLQEDIAIYGENWKRGFLVDALFKHEIHHRAQMTILMRQAGLKVPGVYGPSKEEWAAMGMPEME